MNDQPRRGLNRRSALGLLILVGGSLVGALGTLAAPRAVAAGVAVGQLLIAGLWLDLSVTMIAMLFVLGERGRLSPVLTRRSWLGQPRYAVVIAAIGVCLAILSAIGAVIAALAR